jgi:cysteine-rich repeat protein
MLLEFKRGWKLYSLLAIILVFAIGLYTGLQGEIYFSPCGDDFLGLEEDDNLTLIENLNITIVDEINLSRDLNFTNETIWDNDGNLSNEDDLNESLEEFNETNIADVDGDFNMTNGTVEEIDENASIEESNVSQNVSIENGLNDSLDGDNMANYSDDDLDRDVFIDEDEINRDFDQGSLDGDISDEEFDSDDVDFERANEPDIFIDEDLDARLGPEEDVEEGSRLAWILIGIIGILAVGGIVFVLKKKSISFKWDDFDEKNKKKVKIGLFVVLFVGILIGVFALGYYIANHQSIQFSPIDCCGDGVVDGSEVCDDGNMVNGDGCSDICEFEEIVEEEVVDDEIIEEEIVEEEVVEEFDFLANCEKVDVEAVSCNVNSDDVVVQLVTSGGVTLNTVNAILTKNDGSKIVKALPSVPDELSTGTASYSGIDSEDIVDTDAATASVTIEDFEGDTFTCLDSGVVISCI